MLSQKTIQKIDELVWEATDTAYRTYKAGGNDPSLLEALASLITAVRGDSPGEGSPCIGFVLPVPPEAPESDSG